MISAKLTLTYNCDGSSLGWPKTNFQARVKCLGAEKTTTASTAFCLYLLTPLYQTVDKATAIISLTAAPLSLWSHGYPEHSPYHYLMYSALQQWWGIYKPKLFSLMTRYSHTCAADFSKLIQNWHVSIILKSILSWISEMIWLTS